MIRKDLTDAHENIDGVSRANVADLKRMVVRINGACPIRAKRLGLSIASAQQPYQGSFAKMPARLIGVYAEGAEHRLTHHGTKTHTHALLKDENGQVFTAHVERAGVQAGSILCLPAR